MPNTARAPLGVRPSCSPCCLPSWWISVGPVASPASTASKAVGRASPAPLRTSGSSNGTTRVSAPDGSPTWTPGRGPGIPVAHRQRDEPVERWVEGMRVVLAHLARLWRGGDSRYFLAVSASLESAAMKASWGTSTRPTIFIRFLPSFCFSSSLRLRVMSPP